jgi:hypothetical protein
MTHSTIDPLSICGAPPKGPLSEMAIPTVRAE